MASISPLASAQTTDLASAKNTTASRTPQKALGQQDFLKLLAAQFQAQDPMKPMEDTAFIANMAQFSALEQSTSMVREIEQMRADQRIATATSYLGHTVTVKDAQGAQAVGPVGAIDSSGPQPRLIVNGQQYPLSAVLRVEPGFVTAPAPQPVTAGGA